VKKAEKTRRATTRKVANKQKKTIDLFIRCGAAIYSGGCHMALIYTGITIETATNHVNYYVTRVANSCASRQASVDRNYATTIVATLGTSSV